LLLFVCWCVQYLVKYGERRIYSIVQNCDTNLSYRTWKIMLPSQLTGVYFIWKLFYMFRVVPSPIIKSANNCIYSIWYLSHRYCYLPLSWNSWNWCECAVAGVRPWVPGIFFGGKGGRCVGLTTLPPSCATNLKSRGLMFLANSGPVEAWKGIALSF
jgi:hypothetical protein